jgi:phosphotransferase system IIA component
METGVVTKWLKKEGEMVKKGENLLEIETDKIAYEVQSACSGTLLKILVGEESEVKDRHCWRLSASPVRTSAVSSAKVIRHRKEKNRRKRFGSRRLLQPQRPATKPK